MFRVGFPPYLECSSKGDKHFSAFYARIKSKGNKSIEEIYQASKVFADGSTNLTIKEAKGKLAVNINECKELYSQLWDLYFQENPHLYSKIALYAGFSDLFGNENSQCQAREVYRIWIDYQLRNQSKSMEEYKHLVVNKRQTSEYDVYCGRGSIYGNQYSHLPKSTAEFKVQTVEQAIAHYRYSFIKRCNTDPDFKSKVKLLDGKVLACYCSSPQSPKPCHCYILASAAHVYSRNK